MGLNGETHIGRERSRRAIEAATPGTRLTLMRVWAVVGAIAIGSAALNVFGVLAPVIEFLAVGSLVAFVEAPIVNALEHRGMPRGAAAFIGLLAVIAAVACLVMVVGPMIFNQFLEVLQGLPSQLRSLGSWVSQVAGEFKTLSSSGIAPQLDQALDSLANVATDYVSGIAGEIGRGIVPFISGFASQLFIVFLGLVLAYWLACDYPLIHREIGIIAGEDRELSYRFMVAILSRSVGGYMRGMVITSFVNGALTFLGLLLIGHPYAGLMGVLTGLFHLVPVVGPFASSLVATLLALFADPVMALWTLAVTMVMQNITDNVLSPKVMQSSVQVHPAMSLTAIVVGSALLGPIGMVIAIPLSAALKGLFVFYFEGTTGRRLVDYGGAIFRGTPYHDSEGRPVPAFDALGDDRFVTESEILDDDAVPDATAELKPELDNPWTKLAGIQPGSTGIWRNPFAGDRPDGGAGEGADGGRESDSARGDGGRR